MEKENIFAKNLNLIREMRGQTLTGFSTELGLRRSTLTSILKDGNTTLYTARQISERLGVPLDALLSGEMRRQDFNVIRWFMQGFSTFMALSGEQQEGVSLHVNEILKLLRE